MAKRVVLAYSGGLDTSVAVRWLIEELGVEVIAVAVDVGQGGDFEAVRAAGAGRRGGRGDRRRLPGRVRRATSAARPCGQRPLRGQVPARLVAVAPGDRPAPRRRRPARTGPTPWPTAAPARATTRCASRSAAAPLAPDLEVVAPVREWGMTREDSVEYAERARSRSRATKEKIYSIDENLWGRAIECGVIEDPWARRPRTSTPTTVPTATEPTRARRRLRAGRARRRSTARPCPRTS